MRLLIAELLNQGLLPACCDKVQSRAVCWCQSVMIAEMLLQGSRYDGQIGVFGRTVQRKLEDLKVFLVGAGALGCEFAKNFAMMGVSSGSMGKITMTDDDVIEKSNLSRQFLFRDWNIGRLASNPLYAPLSITQRFLQTEAMHS